jgi:acyl-CoA synthetase (AMP-forming)/AMP-acid ligase II
VLHRPDHARAHLVVRLDDGFDLPGLDPEAANLDLLVRAAGEFEFAVGVVAGEVAGAVHAGAGWSEGVGQEAVGGEVGAIAITSRQGSACEVQVADHPGRHHAQRMIQHVSRINDVIILDGRNHYPQDVEATVEASHHALAANRSAVFCYEHDVETRVGVAAEIARGAQDVQRDEVIRIIRRSVAEQHELRLSSVALLRPGGVPRTTSGKIRRSQTARLLVSGQLNIFES